MRLRGIEFGPALQMSGITNFFGKGYWFHHLFRPIGLQFYGSTFVSKTSTLLARKGNMPLKDDGVTPREPFPRCIIVKHRFQTALNAVGLSGPGLEFLLNEGIWQKWFTYPFFISIMSVAKTAPDRMAELTECFRILSWRRNFNTAFGVQVNFSCPNAGLDPNSLIDEVLPTLESAEQNLYGAIPLMLKFGPDLHPETAAKIAAHTRCDALCVFNTLPFGKQPVWARVTPPVEWEKLFGTADPQQSPLAKRFPGCPGGLSGAPLFPFLLEWLPRARAAGVRKPISAGGGILDVGDIDAAIKVGADSISIGSAAFLKPWRVHSLFQHTITKLHR